MEYYLCVLDFEATCWPNSENKDQMEIIEFPSIIYKINEKKETIEFISEFSKYVKPTINIKLSDYCTSLTGIKQETVDIANTIDQVYQEHINWLVTNIPTDSNFIIATCGHWDLKTQLPREIKNKNLQTNNYYLTYINVKDEFERFYKIKSVDMPNMLKYLSLSLDGHHHSGIDDTRNIAKIILRMIKDGHKISNCVINKVC